jgi:hypothetical protein
MFTQLTTALTLLATLLHSALGCCWYHGHSITSEDGCPVAVATEQHSQRSTCGDHRHDDAVPPSSGDPDHEDCDESRCVYVTSKAGTSATADFAISATAATLVDAVTHDLDAAEQLDSAPDPIVPHQLRALLQVWLI